MNIYIIAGANGSGKTTFAREFLSKYVQCSYFVNADNIAQGLSPFSPELVAIKAGKILLNEISELINQKKSFAFETTLSGRTYALFMKKARRIGYKTHIFYLWIPSSDLARARVRYRVLTGGHNIPANDIKRRFSRSLKNFFELYAPIAETWYFFDNSAYEPALIAKCIKNVKTVYDESKYKRISNIGDG